MDARRNLNELKGIQLTKTEFKISKLLLVTFAQDFAKLVEILTAMDVKENRNERKEMQLIQNGVKY